MNLFMAIFWICLVVDVLVPGVDVGLGWYAFWILLAALTDN